MAMNNIIFTAGGSGKRMNTEIPKQFIPVSGKPMLMWAMQAFELFDASMRKIIVLPAARITLWEDLCKEFNFSISHQLVKGGNTRFESVKNGILHATGNGLTGIHDGVRPFPSIETIRNTFDTASKYGSAIPYIDSTDTLRQIHGDNSQIIDRSKIKRIQTPQVFSTEIIKKAYQQDYRKEFTDDASVVEALGYQVHLCPGNEENLKVTTRMDLRIAIMLGDLMAK
ncbi:MAG: 2-C-methyl-D-erythritol 4-phosphate cytidylyltransferase [Bacteroidales bacterium]